MNPLSDEQLDRRKFFSQARNAVLAGSATALTARSYARVPGANDRIRLAQLGCGHRGQGHVHMVQMAAGRTPVEVVAVCDIWTLARERRATQVKELFGTEP
ncbi:MAG: Gfo/Idh/MocA family protein, partial [Bryobacteraceae bacterium]